MIGEDIEIVIVESKDGNVKIGINAPKHMKIYRNEIFTEIKDENKEALDANINIFKKVLESNK